jgi:hypothetical protein
MASSDETSIYRCVTCGQESVGLTAAWRHTDEFHPETITRSSDADDLRLIDAGNALSAEVEGDLEGRGLVRQTDAPYAEITAKGRALMAVDRAKREILEDVESGRVPADVPGFSALHDYVDANEYGGLCDDDCPVPVGDDEGWIQWGNDVQTEVDQWIKGGGIAEARRS